MKERQKAESSIKEVDKEIVHVKYDMQDLEVGSEAYLNSCKSISALAESKQKLSSVKTNWVTTVGQIAAPIVGVSIVAVAERTQIVDRLIRTWTNVRSAFKFGK